MPTAELPGRGGYISRSVSQKKEQRAQPRFNLFASVLVPKHRAGKAPVQGDPWMTVVIKETFSARLSWKPVSAGAQSKVMPIPSTMPRCGQMGS